MKLKLFSLITLSTMLLNGYGQIDINSSGNVGIGTDSPGSKLHVTDNDRMAIRLGGPSTSSDAVGDIVFVPKDGLSVGGAYYWALSFRTTSWSKSPGDLVFYSYNGSSYTSPLFLQSDGDVILGSGNGAGRNGKVGIGHTDPISKLDVVDGISRFRLQNNSGHSQFLVGNSGSGMAAIYLDASDGDFIGSDYCVINQDNDKNLNIIASANAEDITFQTGGQYRMRITKEGKVGIGTYADPTDHLEVAGNAKISPDDASSGIWFTNDGSAPVIEPQWQHSMKLGLWEKELYCVYTEHLYVDHSYITSDDRLKENLRPLSNSIDRLSQVKSYKFDYKAEIYENSDQANKDKLLEKRTDRMGFVAQEIKEIYPELVDYDKEADRYYVNYVGLIPELVEAIKVQHSQISELQSEITQLKSDNDLKSASISDLMDVSQDANTLYQNSPNPFSEITEIRYVLSENAKNGIINIYDINGSQIRSYDLQNKGFAAIQINGGELRPGLYMYAMMLDGALVNTKQMVITD